MGLLMLQTGMNNSQQRQKMLRRAAKSSSLGSHMSHGSTLRSNVVEQRDRSLTVMIPRAKYRPAPAQPGSTLLTLSTFGPEQKLLNYLSPDGHHTPVDKQVSVKKHHF